MLNNAMHVNVRKSLIPRKITFNLTRVLCKFIKINAERVQSWKRET